MTSRSYEAGYKKHALSRHSRNRARGLRQAISKTLPFVEIRPTQEASVISVVWDCYWGGNLCRARRCLPARQIYNSQAFQPCRQ